MAWEGGGDNSPVFRGRGTNYGTHAADTAAVAAAATWLALLGRRRGGVKEGSLFVTPAPFPPPFLPPSPLPSSVRPVLFTRVSSWVGVERDGRGRKKRKREKRRGKKREGEAGGRDGGVVVRERRESKEERREE